MRLAVWTPLPPARTGIADYNASLLAALATRACVTAVVDDRYLACSAHIPGVALMGAGEAVAKADDFDLHIYHMGNHLAWHGYMHEQAQAVPGLLVLHDLSLWDLYTELCGPHSVALAHELRLNHNDRAGERPTVVVDTEEHREIDRLATPFTARLVRAARAIVVHSTWGEKRLQQLYPGVVVRHVPLAAAPSRASAVAPTTTCTIAALGGLGAHKRVPTVIRAFAATHARHPSARLIIAGRSESEELSQSLNDLVVTHHLSDVVRVQTDVTEEQLDVYLATSTVVVSLRWPTAGETSAILMRALASGTPVITSDAPQMRELDEQFCWRVSTDPHKEVAELSDLFDWVITHPEECRSAGELARVSVLAEASVDRVADAFVEIARDLLTPHSSTRRTAVSANVIADWQGTTGLTEAARSATLALITNEVRLARTTVKVYPVRDPERVPPQILALPEGRFYDTDLWFLNINETHLLSDADLRPPGRAQYAIASWYWEMSALPEILVEQLHRFDEVWAATRFVGNAFRRHTERPVRIIPPVVQPCPDPTVGRSDFGLPHEAFTFLFSFDLNSTLARKNPEGVVRAFQSAFSVRERETNVRLVLKVSSLTDSEPSRHLRRVAQAEGVHLIEHDLTRSEMDSLLAACDAYVSLHRSEGFGLGMAEAMYLGKPVIATAYSGNMDFTTHTNSCLVGGRIRAISTSDWRLQPQAARLYEPGLLWAEPDIAQAARWMRILVEQPDVGARVGGAAARTIREQYNPQAAAAAMRTRLQELNRNAPEEVAGTPSTSPLS